jgi:hypothetical protein
MSLAAMTMPFDTLKLARRLEGAGFTAQQAGDMAEAFAEPLANFVTKADLEQAVETLRREINQAVEMLRRDLTIRLGGMMIVAVGVILSAMAAMLTVAVRLLH